MSSWHILFLGFVLRRMHIRYASCLGEAALLQFEYTLTCCRHLDNTLSTIVSQVIVPLGTVTGVSAAGAAVCIEQCAPGSGVSNFTSRSCAQCTPGTFRSTASNLCQACPPGTFSNVSAASACTPCSGKTRLHVRQLCQHTHSGQVNAPGGPLRPDSYLETARPQAILQTLCCARMVLGF
jgi:hypothetical protein